MIWHTSVSEKKAAINESLRNLYERSQPSREKFEEFSKRTGAEYQMLKDQGLVMEMMFKIYFPQVQTGCEQVRTQRLGNEIFEQSQEYLDYANYYNWLSDERI